MADVAAWQREPTTIQTMCKGADVQRPCPGSRSRGHGRSAKPSRRCPASGATCPPSGAPPPRTSASKPPRHARAATEPDRLDLTGALRQLPPQQRAVVALRFPDDLSVAETVAALDVAEGTVKSQTSRALANLRQLFPDLEVEEEMLR